MEEKNLTIAKKLNESVGNVLGQTSLEGFEKAYLIAEATGRLKQLLTPEYMKPIMQLQGNRLGFKTDKDDKGGYTEDQVRNCLIEAVLTGVQPFGNQFNIIANNTYITKEGFGYLLKNYSGLSYDIVPALPRINADKTSAAIDMHISWSINGIRREKTLPIPVKMNAYMGTDAVIGKATRKARAWLYNTITGSEISDGDADDVKGRIIIDPHPEDNVAAGKEYQRKIDFINSATSAEQLKEVEPHLTDDILKTLYEEKLKSF